MDSPLIDLLGCDWTRADHGPVRTAGSDRNRGKKTEIGTENSVSEPKPDSKPIKIRFRFGPKDRKSTRLNSSHRP